MWKQIVAKVVVNKHVVGFDAMRRVAMEVNAVVNKQNRTGGFSPAQWVLGRRPRYSAGEQGDDETAGQLGSLEQRDDPTTIFGERMAYRHEAKKAFVHVDSSKRVASALLRNAAPKVGVYQVGDLSRSKGNNDQLEFSETAGHHPLAL